MGNILHRNNHTTIIYSHLKKHIDNLKKAAIKEEIKDDGLRQNWNNLCDEFRGYCSRKDEDEFKEHLNFMMIE